MTLNRGINRIICTIVLAICISGCNNLGGAKTTPIYSNPTIYNLLSEISSGTFNDIGGFRIVIPDDSSPHLISAIAGLASSIKFVGAPTITETEYTKLETSEQQYIILITKSPSTYGIEKQIYLDISNGAKLYIASNEEGQLISQVNILTDYLNNKPELNYKCVKVYDQQITPCEQDKNLLVNCKLLLDSNKDLIYDWKDCTSSRFVRGWNKNYKACSKIGCLREDINDKFGQCSGGNFIHDAWFSCLNPIDPISCSAVKESDLYGLECSDIGCEKIDSTGLCT